MGVLADEDDVEDATTLLELSVVAPQELMKSVTVVVAVEAPVIVCVSV